MRTKSRAEEQHQGPYSREGMKEKPNAMLRSNLRYITATTLLIYPGMISTYHKRVYESKSLKGR